MNAPTQLSLRNIQKSFPGKERLCPVLGGLTFDIYHQHPADNALNSKNRAEETVTWPIVAMKDRKQ
jgi:hypothetical protein